MAQIGKTVSRRSCPKCRVTLNIALGGEGEVDTCPSCRGIWVDHVEEKAVLKIKPEAFTIDELRRLRKAYQPLGRMESVRYVSCPVCGEWMNRKNWGTHSGVIVDTCEDHGIWYDEGELEKVREFVTLGGIEYEKYRLAERGLSELTSRLTREVSRLDQRIDSAYRRARLFSLLLE